MLRSAGGDKGTNIHYLLCTFIPPNCFPPLQGSLPEDAKPSKGSIPCRVDPYGSRMIKVCVNKIYAAVVGGAHQKVQRGGYSTVQPLSFHPP